MNTQARITAAADDAIRVLSLPASQSADLLMSGRISAARTQLADANRRADLFAAACAVEALQRAVEDRAA